MDFVDILNPSTGQQEISNAGGNAAQAQLVLGPFEANALILVTAHGTAQYQGPVNNAGIILMVNRDGATVAMDDSFEGESSSINFRSAASYNFILKKRTTATVEAKVEHSGAGGQNNKQTKVSLQCFALAVKP